MSDAGTIQEEKPKSIIPPKNKSLEFFVFMTHKMIPEFFEFKCPCETSKYPYVDKIICERKGEGHGCKFLKGCIAYNKNKAFIKAHPEADWEETEKTSKVVADKILEERNLEVQVIEDVGIG